MNRNQQIVFLLGTAMLAGGGVIAATGKSAPAAIQKPALGDTARSRAASGNRYLSRYDLNGDGKVTRDELMKVAGEHFAQAGASGGTLTKAQFVNQRLDQVRKHSDQIFHRIDWSGDGRLDLQEYMASERTRFERMDRQANGEVACHRYRSRSASDSGRGAETQSPSRAGTRGATSFCGQLDANHDGKVTHAEFDAAMTKEFHTLAKNGTLDAAGFDGMIAGHIRDSQTRKFERLDTNHDGKLTLAEFAAPELKTFARTDKNNDGVVTRDEIEAARQSHRYVNNRNPGAYHPG